MQRLLVTTQTTKTSYPSRLRAAFSCARGIIGQMRFRKLRIAFSATCLIACLLLIVLWVRSYWKSDEIRYISFAKGHIYSSYSSYGVLTLSYGTDARFQSLGRRPRWRISSQGHDYPGLSEEAKTNARKGESKQFLWSNRLPSSFSAKAPYWLITLLIVASGVVPLLRWRARRRRAGGTK